MAKQKKYVYFFGGKKAEGKAGMKNLLGGKGANLAEMTNLGIIVPAGFTITTEVCTAYYENRKKYPKSLKDEVMKNLAKIEKTMGAVFGDKDNPLLVSVRSGARASMPGMMDTVLNLGLNDITVQGLIKMSGNQRFTYDCYRRFVQMYGDVVLGLKPEGKEEDPFELLIQQKKKEKNIKYDSELKAEDLKELVSQFKAMIKSKLNIDFPEDPIEQLWGGIGAVFSSWMGKRAIEYRRLNKIPEDWGTAVNVQSMVYGNMGNDSATGVAFTRDPATGEKKFFGEFLINAQGEDVVAGIRTPQPINKLGKRDEKEVSLEEAMPVVYKELEGIYKKLEKHYKDIQDIEFTIQKDKLYMLQTRVGKRTAAAAVKIAVDMVNEKLIDKKTAVKRVSPEQIDQLLHPTIDPKAKVEVLAKGLPASPGAVSGRVVFSAEDAVKWAKNGEKVILVRIETSPEDIAGMDAAQGILTGRGGMTSHAAVVARGMGKCCVAGCGALEISYEKAQFKAGEVIIKQGDWISLDGITGRVILGKVPTINPQVSGDFGILMSWADQISKIHVRTNADTPNDARVARDFGAKGIGLCRTEHMFFGGNRIMAVREMILADDEPGRRKALDKLIVMQRSDFEGIFEAMNGLPVIIRLLDPPLHEFLPKETRDMEALAKEMGISVEKLRQKSDSLHEMNPMLGHRGCRLGISFPEITEMQARAIFEAACGLTKKGIKVIPEVMIPLVGHENELKNQKAVIEKIAKETIKASGVKLKYMIGTMIEIPRACVVADRIAVDAEFFSFGTNDLTQMTFGFSRDDAGKFLADYYKIGILKVDPFATVDQEGVGELMKMAIAKGRKVNKKLEIGICGEHGGDPETVKFCHRIGMNYVSCSPYRVPIARLAAAHAVLEESKK